MKSPPMGGIEDMLRQFFILIIMVCFILITGCGNFAEGETTEKQEVVKTEFVPDGQEIEEQEVVKTESVPDGQEIEEQETVEAGAAINGQETVEVEPSADKTSMENQPEDSTSEMELQEVKNDQENSSDGDIDMESVEPFVDEKLWLYIKKVYDEVDYDIQFLRGDESKYDLYREQFIKLLKEEIPVVDKKGYEKTLSHFGEIKEDDSYSDYAPDHYNYYFYDVDGDGAPELGMTNNRRFVYIFKYKEETDKVVMWDEYYLGVSLMGTGRFHWSGPNADSGMMGLDQNGDYTMLTRFRAEGGSKYINDGDDGWAYFVTLPDYVELEEWMRKQATYKDRPWFPNYFFRLTKEQFDELEERYFEASHESDEKKEEVTYTYAELLNLK